jgi:hypothetical protein
LNLDECNLHLCYHTTSSVTGIHHKT